MTERLKGHAQQHLLKVVMSFVGDECLPWTFARLRKGEGSVTWEGRRQTVGRVICILRHGPPPTPLHEGAHSCGKGHEGCCNPAHLSWKTPKENNADKIAHGTLPVGERVRTAKLTAAQVLEARRLRGVVSQQSIADRFGVSQAVISKAQLGQTWAHLAPD